MKILNEMKIKFLSKSINESFARSAAALFIAQLDPDVNELADIKTAVSEAVTNCIVHAYINNMGIIELTVRILEENEIYIKIKDNGIGIPDIEKAREPLFTTLPSEERSGLGFSVMESFMDKLSVKSKINKGTTVIMRKKLSVRSEKNV
ncbi:MAG: anti-sigma F factor [Oscillospiraceae bacterium]